VAKFKSRVPTIIIANNSLFREGLSRILTSDKYEVVASTASFDTDLVGSLKLHDSNLLVLGAGQDAEETVSQLRMYRELNNNGYIVIVAQDEKSLGILPALRAGAHACLTKDTTSDALLKTIELVMLGETVVPHGMLPALLDREESSRQELIMETIASKPAIEVVSERMRPFEMRSCGDLPQLSAQEKRILSCLIVGDSNKIIARKVDIAEATVKVHVKAIFRKLGLKNRTQAAVWALNQGSYGLSATNDMLPPMQHSHPDRTTVVENSIQTT